jgi:GNAT superfamily N-acetyltransferase
MFTELHPDEFDGVEVFFKGFTHSLSIKAVLGGNNLGRVFVNDPADPHWAFAMTIEGYLLGGNPNNAAARQHLADFFMEEIFTGKTYLDDNTTMTLGVDPSGWEDYLLEMIPTHELEKLDRYQYLCREVKFDWRSQLPDGFTIRPVEAAMLVEGAKEVDPYVAEWGFMLKGWHSLEKFFSEGGGMAVLHEGRVVGWSLADCYYQDQIDIGIVIAPEHRRHGLAACTAAAMTERCLERGFKQVGWHCQDTNIGSWKTAEKVGFQRASEYNYFYYMLDEIDHLAELGWYYFQKGEHEKTRAYYEQVFSRREDCSDYYYHLAAVVWAEIGEEEKALDYLGQAALRGWFAVEYTASLEAFDCIRTRPEWKEIQQKMAANQIAD